MKENISNKEFQSDEYITQNERDRKHYFILGILFLISSVFSFILGTKLNKNIMPGIILQLSAGIALICNNLPTKTHRKRKDIDKIKNSKEGQIG